MSWNHLKRFGAGAVLAVAISPVWGAVADVPESQEPIKIAVQEAAGQYFNAHILGRVLEEAGYTVEYISAGYYPQVQGVADGDIHMALGLWSSNIGEGWMELFDSGEVLDAGEIGYMGVETWYANDAALAACPGIENDIMVLNDCAQALATAETFPKGRLLDYPIEWGTTNELRIVALDLPLVSQPAGSEGALVAEIKSAEERGEPLLIQFWSPHGIMADHNLTEVGLPEYFDGCYEDPAGGVNPDATYDCDWSAARIWNTAWPGTPDQWPVGYRILQNIDMQPQDQIEMEDAISKGADMDAYIEQWLADNQDRWQGWIAVAQNP
jgi:glycine betaine/proline transport system substrate-binding protein